MKNKILAAVTGLTVVLIAGCSPVQFYSNNNLKAKTGLKYYTVKPFLQVERNTETNQIIKAVVIYLPDLANPQYMVIHDGLNSRKLNLKFTDGTINTFGYASTGKVAESVDALSAILSKSVDVASDLKSMNNLQAVKAGSNNVELYEIIISPEKTTLRKVAVE